MAGNNNCHCCPECKADYRPGGRHGHGNGPVAQWNNGCVILLGFAGLLPPHEQELFDDGLVAYATETGNATTKLPKDVQPLLDAHPNIPPDTRVHDALLTRLQSSPYVEGEWAGTMRGFQSVKVIVQLVRCEIRQVPADFKRKEDRKSNLDKGQSHKRDPSTTLGCYKHSDKTVTNASTVSGQFKAIVGKKRRIDNSERAYEAWAEAPDGILQRLLPKDPNTMSPEEKTELMVKIGGPDMLLRRGPNGATVRGDVEKVHFCADDFLNPVVGDKFAVAHGTLKHPFRNGVFLDELDGNQLEPGTLVPKALQDKKRRPASRRAGMRRGDGTATRRGPAGNKQGDNFVFASSSLGCVYHHLQGAHGWNGIDKAYLGVFDPDQLPNFFQWKHNKAVVPSTAMFAVAAQDMTVVAHAWFEVDPVANTTVRIYPNTAGIPNAP